VTGKPLAGWARTALSVVMLCSASAVSQASSVADFYRGKSVSLVVGIAPGGGYDTTARLVARHIGKYIPGNPTVTVQNMPGDNSVLAANYAYNVAPQDGTVLWTGSRSSPYEPLMGNPAARFNPVKVGWIGSISSEIAVIFAWHTAPHQSAEDLFKYDMTVGATDPGSENFVFPNAYNKVLGTRFKIVRAYASQAAIVQAMEQGELQGDGNSAWSSFPNVHAKWLADGQARLLMQSALRRHPELPDVPTALEFAQTDEQREILQILLSMKTYGYPYATGPGVPRDRVRALRRAFTATMKDSAFLADVTRLLRKITPASGRDMSQAVATAYALPPDMIGKVRSVVSND
jgi:tripartite-type tricarboxylate transporter receptor subunit TctC